MAVIEDDATTPNYEGEEEEDKEEVVLEISFNKHIKYFKRVLDVLPCSLCSLDNNRMTLVFFAVSGLDLLGALDSMSAKEKKDVSDWIYAQQILPGENGDTSFCGFRGSSFIGAPFEGTAGRSIPYDTSHIAMGYTAIATLLILGDDLSRVNRAAILDGIRRLQLPNGSFSSTAKGSESDMRFVYCAASMCHMLGDWTAIDVEKTTEFIKLSQGYDGGIGQGPFLESHGGSTFCGVAALSLMGKLDDAFSPAKHKRLMEWCLFRQQTGFQGRPNKPVDTCYSFWVGATLEILGGFHFVDREWNERYVLSTENTVCGGLSKWPEHHPDPLHTYLGLCGLSLNGDRKLRPVHAALNISQRAVQHLNTLTTHT